MFPVIFYQVLLLDNFLFLDYVNLSWLAVLCVMIPLLIQGWFKVHILVLHYWEELSVD